MVEMTSSLRSTMQTRQKFTAQRTEENISDLELFQCDPSGICGNIFYYLVCKLGAPEVLWQKLVTVVIGLLVGGIGLAMYQNAKAGASPYDSLSMILCNRWQTLSTGNL